MYTALLLYRTRFSRFMSLPCPLERMVPYRVLLRSCNEVNPGSIKGIHIVIREIPPVHKDEVCIYIMYTKVTDGSCYSRNVIYVAGSDTEHERVSGVPLYDSSHFGLPGYFAILVAYCCQWKMYIVRHPGAVYKDCRI